MKGLAYTIFMIFVVSMMLFYIVQISYYESYYVESKESFFFTGFTLKQIKDAFESDLPRSMDVALKRALVEVINNETYTGTFYNGVEDILHLLAYEGQYLNFPTDFMVNSSVKYWLVKFNSIAGVKNIEVKEIIHDYVINLSWYDEIKYCYNISYIISDVINEQEYRKNERICTLTKIKEFEDPYITVKSYENIISSFKMCAFVKGKSSSGSFYGLAFKPPTNDLSTIPNKNDYVLVVENLSEYSGYDGFAGYVLYYEDALPSQNYITGINISNVINYTYVAVDSNMLWITNKSKGEFSSTCYFSWYGGLSFMERLKGNDFSSPYKVATLVDTSTLPPELNPSGDVMLDIEVFPL